MHTCLNPSPNRDTHDRNGNKSGYKTNKGTVNTIKIESKEK